MMPKKIEILPDQPMAIIHLSQMTPDMIVPKDLRDADTGQKLEWLWIHTCCGSMLADAIEIADSCARADIECNVPLVDGALDEEKLRAYDLSRISHDDEELIRQSMRYLTA